MYQSDNRAIVKNTIILYVRMFLTMGISLYVSRSILETLGETNYGIYNAVGGFVAMFSLISGAMSSATQRYIAFEIAKGEEGRVKSVFSTALYIHIGLAVLIVLLGELFGTWFVNSQMNFPPDRYSAATIVFHLSLITFAVNIISVPYNSAIIAYEKLSAFAYISILEVLLNLGVAFMIKESPFDVLVYYALLLALVAILIRVIYSIYVKRHFEKCRIEKKLDVPLIKEMLSYVGWNTIGQIAGTVKSQGLNILSNIFFGAGVNAARGLADQISGAVTRFTTNFQMALNPQIIKLYASEQLDKMYLLVFRGCKLSYLLLMLLSMPVIIEAPFVLSIWLVKVPLYTVNFVRIILVTVLIESLSQPLITAMLASGKIRDYQIVVGGTMLLTLPIAYLVLKLGGDPYSVLYVSLLFSILCLILRIVMLRRSIGFPIARFFKEVIGRIALITILTVIPLVILYNVLEETWWAFIIISCVSVILSCVFSFFIGLDNYERHVAKDYIYRKILKRHE